MPSIRLSESGVSLSEMVLCGAFENTDSSELDTDCLATLGASENSISAIELNKLSKKSPALFRDARLEGKHWTFDFHVLLGREVKRGPESLTAYLACNLVSDREREAWLLLGADDEANIWLNGKPVFSQKGSHSLITYDRAVKLNLNKGANFFLAKVVNLDGDWGFVGRIEVNAEQAAEVVLKRGAHLLRSSVLPASNSPLELLEEKLPIALSGDGNCTNVLTKQSVPIRFVNGKEVSERNRPAGLYQVKLTLQGNEVSQCFLVGDIATTRAGMEKQLESFCTDDRTQIGLQTYAERLRIIQDAETRNRTVNEWDRNILTGDLGYKAVFAAQAFQEAAARIESGAPAFQDVHGLLLRAFRSKIDDQVLHYRIFVPSSYERKRAPLGLIIVTHPIFSVPRSFIEGVEVASHTEAERWGRVAEKLGIGVLWVGYRVCPYGNPIEAAHLEEVLGSVAEDYKLDPDRLGLYGECSGALGAALAVRQNPGRYSGIFFLNPILKRLKNRMDDDGRFVTFPGFAAWMAEQDPIAPLSKQSIAINMINDSTDPAHGPLEHSLAFSAAAKQKGKSIIFEQPKAQAGEWFEATLVPRLAWLASQRRKVPAAVERPEARSNGPISRFFTERFILVVPSEGPSDEREAGVELAEAFQKTWTRTNFGRCRMVLDRELTAEEESSSNLVLIGSPSCNLVWKRMANSLYVQLSDDGIQVGRNHIQMKEACIQAWCPHPSIANKKVLLIGGNSAKGSRFGTLELALDGWFDFSVWAQNKPRDVLLSAERYPDRL